MGPAVAAVAAALLAVAGAGLPPCSLGSRGSDGRLCAETRALGGQATALALRGGGAGQRARDPGSAAGGRRRAKRGFTYPGTLWCGAGNIAESYEQLGEHQETDKCCREHDHCQHLIYPFTYKYGHRNLRWHTISHCDCDRRLKDCLSAVNDTSSRVVGQAFFNIIQVPCFELAYKEACVESYLYVWCKNYSTAAVAVLQDPVMFEHGGERIDAPATRRPQPASSTAVPPTSTFRPAGSSAPLPPRKPGQTAQRRPSPGPRPRPSSSPPKPRRGKGKERRGRKGKGAKRKQKGARAEAGAPAPLLRPTREGAAISLKQLAGQDPGKGGAQAPGGHPEVGRGDAFNAILSDEPGAGGTEPGAGAPPGSMQTLPLKGATPGPSGGAGRRRGRRRKLLQEEEATPPRRERRSVPGRDPGEEAGAPRDGLAPPAYGNGSLLRLLPSLQSCLAQGQSGPESKEVKGACQWQGEDPRYPEGQPAFATGAKESRRPHLPPGAASAQPGSRVCACASGARRNVPPAAHSQYGPAQWPTLASPVPLPPAAQR
ncbi:protein PROCA1 [Candoia aspera]|uniref:protein PROCA1 n=1 Tax=Candoia aspera TaxID=51853 RepID=UPI002FD7C837